MKQIKPWMEICLVRLSDLCAKIPDKALILAFVVLSIVDVPKIVYRMVGIDKVESRNHASNLRLEAKAYYDADASKSPSTKYGYIHKHEYETVTKEIQNRIEHEHFLFLYQYVIIGGVLYCLFQLMKSEKVHRHNPSIVAFALGAVAISLLMVDARIEYNSRIISDLGQYLAIYHDLDRPSGWETHIATNSGFFSASWFPATRLLILLPCAVILTVYYMIHFHIGTTTTNADDNSATKIQSQNESDQNTVPSSILNWLFIFVGVLHAGISTMLMWPFDGPSYVNLWHFQTAILIVLAVVLYRRGRLPQAKNIMKEAEE